MNQTEKYNLLEFWSSALGISLASEGQLVCRYNQSLKFYIYDERNGQHNRIHFHALLNNNKVASIFLDNMEVDFLSSRIKQSDKKRIISWVKNNKKELSEIRQMENGEFEIPFLGYS